VTSSTEAQARARSRLFRSSGPYPAKKASSARRTPASARRLPGHGPRPRAPMAVPSRWRSNAQRGAIVVGRSTDRGQMVLRRSEHPHPTGHSTGEAPTAGQRRPAAAASAESPTRTSRTPCSSEEPAVVGRLRQQVDLIGYAPLVNGCPTRSDARRAARRRARGGGSPAATSPSRPPRRFRDGAPRRA
jgi:hypothetical protein